ncbi:MAG: SUMF1/EgtB/PvdO family nonheme iron enzyme, partial [Deltaproteobacteria bacterium]|nr:SUMF1/EgtB/PvdO family nonheme iron enzyme [Deltaproteobacteria bacterium]
MSPLDGAEMVLIPGGPFTMGITEDELRQIYLLDQRQTVVFATEVPARAVQVESFYIDRYPVTNYQYRKFVEETGHREPLLWREPMWSQPMQPVVFVGWD